MLLATPFSATVPCSSTKRPAVTAMVDHSATSRARRSSGRECVRTMRWKSDTTMAGLARHRSSGAAVVARDGQASAAREPTAGARRARAREGARCGGPRGA
jgi:hypothetical protein